MAPLALTSLRKLVLVTVWRACALQRLVSPLVTTPLALTSPTSTPIVPETLPVAPVESTVPVRVTVRYCVLGTPVRLTVHWFGFGPALTDPVLAVPHSTGFKKVKTIA